MKISLFGLFCITVVVLMSPVLMAQNDVEIQTYKQKLMGSNGLQMGMIGQIMQMNLPFKNHVQLHALAIQQNNKMFVEASRKKLPLGRTDSKPAVWENWDQFAQAAESSEKAAAELAQAGEGEILSKMRALGGTCGACHQMFRKPKSEQFVR